MDKPADTVSESLTPLADDDLSQTPLPADALSATDQPLPPPPDPAAWQVPAGWGKQSSTAKFGLVERICLGLGGFLLLLGIVLNLLPVLGTQVARFQGAGTLGQAVGLLLGLLGAGLLAFSLRRFKAASLIGGGAGAAFVFIVFMASVFGGNRSDEEEMPVVQPATEQEQFAIDMTRVSSPWIGTWPNWEGFDDDEMGLPSPADKWRRVAVPDLNISAQFLGQPTTSESRLRVNRQNARVREISASVQNQKFALGVFRYPASADQTNRRILDDVQSAIGNIEHTHSVSVSGHPGRSYQIIDSARSVDGCFVLMDDLVVHIRVTGPSSRVPGPVSEKFVTSLRLGEDAAPSRAVVPEIKLDEQQQARNETLLENVRSLENLMDSSIHPRCRMNFAPHYLSASAGQDRGQRRFIVHPAKLPVIGIDLIEVNTNAGKVIANIAPIYEHATDSKSLMAREGYALAAINVNADQWVKGVQFVFMEITPRGFNKGRSYTSKWYGTPASGTGQRLGGDGRPVYGIWMYRSRYVKSLGLIRERN